MNNGTAYSTLAAFKTIVSPRWFLSSISEVPKFFVHVEQNANFITFNELLNQIESKRNEYF
jgi:hypothetical protein